ncbi:MAG: MBL fold metallo-hydrolase [Patescibacteria group bacterium]
MKITKFGHSCLLIEEKDARILIDPGSYSTGQNDVRDVDVILITHEHQDHLSVESLQKILPNNPVAKIYTNSEVGQKLSEAGILWEQLGDKEQVTVKGLLIEGVGADHALVYKTIPVVRNTGYMIANRFFYPGDALNVPDKPVEILAYPTVAPWMRMAEAVDFAKAIKPKVAFPVHDAFLKFPGPYYRFPEQELGAIGTKWSVIEEGKSIEV